MVKLYFILIALTEFFISEFAPSSTCYRLHVAGVTQSHTSHFNLESSYKLQENMRSLNLLSFHAYGNAEQVRLAGNNGIEPGYNLNAKWLSGKEGFVFRYQPLGGRPNSPKPPIEIQVVVIRGSVTYGDWKENLFGSFLEVPQALGSRGSIQGKVHRGFMKAALRYKRELIGRRLILSHPRKPIIIAGHSRGGAIAPLLAHELQKKPRMSILGIYSFGAPKFSDIHFASYMQRSRLRRKVLRTVTKGDSIVLSPVAGPLLQRLAADPIGFFRVVPRISIFHSNFVASLKKHWSQFVHPGKSYYMINRGTRGEAAACLSAVNKALGYYIKKYGIKFPEGESEHESAEYFQRILEEVQREVDLGISYQRCITYHTQSYITGLGLQNGMFCREVRICFL